MHLLNRGNDRSTVFHSIYDYRDFVVLLREARARFDVEVFAFALMPNHFHLVARPASSAALRAYMHWLLTSHVRRHRRRHGGSGHVWQGRFKSFPVQNDGHALTVMRYVLRNPIRAGLATSVVDWPWSSFHGASMVDAWPVAAPPDLRAWVDANEDETQLARLRQSVRRRAPFGDVAWTAQFASEHGLQATVHRRGRPRGPSTRRSFVVDAPALLGPAGVWVDES